MTWRRSCSTGVDRLLQNSILKCVCEPSRSCRMPSMRMSMSEHAMTQMLNEHSDILEQMLKKHKPVRIHQRGQHFLSLRSSSNGPHRFVVRLHPCIPVSVFSKVLPPDKKKIHAVTVFFSPRLLCQVALNIHSPSAERRHSWEPSNQIAHWRRFRHGRNPSAR